MTVRVLIVDDHAVVRAGLRLLIDAEEDLETIGEAGSVREAVFEARAHEPDLILMDVVMPGESGIQGVPILKPPYGNLVAIDLNRGAIAWKVPFGDMPQLRSNPALKDVALPARLGAAGAAGVIVTKSGLILGGGNDSALNAFDAKDGRELWRHVLPREAGGTPVTYLDANGRQVVVIATGRGEDTALVAFALPKS